MLISGLTALGGISIHVLILGNKLCTKCILSVQELKSF